MSPPVAVLRELIEIQTVLAAHCACLVQEGTDQASAMAAATALSDRVLACWDAVRGNRPSTDVITWADVRSGMVLCFAVLSEYLEEAV